MDSFNQFNQFFNHLAPQAPNQQQFGQPGPAPPAGAGAGAARAGGGSPGVDQLANQLELSFIDIPELISLSDEEEEKLPPEARKRRRAEKLRKEAAARQAALQRSLAGQGVVGAAPSGFDPTAYQQHLAQLAAQQAHQAQQLAAQQQAHQAQAQQQGAQPEQHQALFQQHQHQQAQQQAFFQQQQQQLQQQLQHQAQHQQQGFALGQGQQAQQQPQQGFGQQQPGFGFGRHPERLRDAAPADLLQGGGFLEALGSPALHSPLQLPDAGEQAAAEPAVGAATLAGSPHGGSQAPPTADSDSSAKVARFLSRLPAVTLKRGTCMPRRRPFDSPSPLSSQSLAGSGSASRPAGGAASERRSSGGASWLLGRPALRALQVEAEGAQLERQQPAACGVDKTEQRPSLAEGSRLPATTLVQLGPRLRRPPPHRATLQGCAEMHSSGAIADLPPLSFHASAVALPEEGGELEFVAGDTARGARILYDILPDGRRLYALTIVQSIYRLGDEAWMEHRYLLSQQDLLERPAWAAALRGVTIKEGELLLSAAAYHSPMHLVSGAVTVRYPGRVQLASVAATAAAKAPGGGAHGGAAAEVYTCKRGFDTARGTVVALRRALEGLGQLGG
ncbi:hypothetical protein C2E20_5305 [Micractinium conductrix]|uniref:Uncharacterized protein n=1 Tax=Micractinium conductrix TaxID=554055 RepID=A0A2P6VBF1_9CHLO|nr:hypothetical protein C2E20_5305 [Micractinium conductrix]|eukprot:PSC71414.1 hypothetical protein C2E20_5305 [Micractinium conductrix]